MVSWQQWIKNLVSKGLMDSQGFGVTPVLVRLTISEVAITSFYACARGACTCLSEQEFDRTNFKLSKWLSVLPCLSHALNVQHFTNFLQSSS